MIKWSQQIIDISLWIDQLSGITRSWLGTSEILFENNKQTSSQIKSSLSWLHF